MIKTIVLLILIAVFGKYYQVYTDQREQEFDLKEKKATSKIEN